MPLIEVQNLLNGFSIIDILPVIKDEAINIRQATRMKLPDAVIAATAIVLDATCLSNDDDLLDLVWPNYRVQEIPFTQPQTL
jgi:predicted nucleic acid-binding protein